MIPRCEDCHVVAELNTDPTRREGVRAYSIPGARESAMGQEEIVSERF